MVDNSIKAEKQSNELREGRGFVDQLFVITNMCEKGNKKEGVILVFYES